MDRLLSWFTQKGWKPFDFQRQAWDAYLSGKSGLIHAPTGTGKTQAAWAGPLLEWMAEQSMSAGRAAATPEGLRVLWITPLRALATDTLESLRAPVEGMGLGWTIETRTSDTSATIRKRQ